MARLYLLLEISGGGAIDRILVSVHELFADGQYRELAQLFPHNWECAREMVQAVLSVNTVSAPDNTEFPGIKMSELVSLVNLTAKLRISRRKRDKHPFLLFEKYSDGRHFNGVPVL